MNTVQEMLLARGAYLCVACGKCVALCPMAETARSFSANSSPKGLIAQAVKGAEMGEMSALRDCLQCRSCSEVCPQNVDVAGLILDLRSLLPDLDSPTCQICGTKLRSSGQRYLTEALGSIMAYRGLCPDCKRKAYLRNNS